MGICGGSSTRRITKRRMCTHHPHIIYQHNIYTTLYIQIVFKTSSPVLCTCYVLRVTAVSFVVYLLFQARSIVTSPGAPALILVFSSHVVPLQAISVMLL
jgi:hypothetical protein